VSGFQPVRQGFESLNPFQTIGVLNGIFTTKYRYLYNNDSGDLMYILMYREAKNPGTWTVKEVDSLEHGLMVLNLIEFHADPNILEAKVKQVQTTSR
jgi:hypothetical protein